MECGLIELEYFDGLSFVECAKDNYEDLILDLGENAISISYTEAFKLVETMKCYIEKSQIKRIIPDTIILKYNNYKYKLVNIG